MENQTKFISTEQCQALKRTLTAVSLLSFSSREGKFILDTDVSGLVQCCLRSKKELRRLVLTLIMF